METVLVTLRTTMSPKGVSRITKDTPEVRRVVAKYIDGTVQDHVGEVWKVVKNHRGRADYKTVR